MSDDLLRKGNKMSYFEFPHTRTYNSDLGWLIKNFKTMASLLETLNAWKAKHEPEYKELYDKVDGLIHNLVDVIVPWDSSVAYHVFSIVEYQGTNYIAVQNVPVGVMITNTDYWQPANTVTEQLNAISVTVSEIEDTVDTFENMGGISTMYCGFLGRIIGNRDHSTYASAQGLAAEEDQNGGTVIYTAWTDYADVQNIIIEKISSSGTVLATSSPMQIGHGDIALDSENRIIYAAWEGDLHRINADTLAYIDSLSLPIQTADDITIGDGCFYIKSGGTIYKVPLDLSSIETEFIIPGYLEQTTAAQSLTYWNGTIYIVLNQPNSILCYSTELKRIINYIHMNEFLSNYYPLGEMQAIGIYNDDGDFIVNGKPREYNRAATGFDQYEVGHSICAYGIGNIRTNNTFINRYQQVAMPKFTASALVNAGTYTFKPLGTGTYPFNTLGEVALVLNAEQYKPSTIDIRSAFTDEDLVLKQVKGLILQCNNNAIKTIVCTDSEVSIYDGLADDRFDIMGGVVSMSNCRNNGTIHTNNVFDACIVYGSKTDNALILDNKYNLLHGAIVIANSNLYMGGNYVELGRGTLSSGDESQDATVSLSTAINLFNEVHIEIIKPSNNRVIGSATVRRQSFVNGAVYVPVMDALNHSVSPTYHSVVIWNNNTQVTIAGHDGIYVIYAK